MAFKLQLLVICQLLVNVLMVSGFHDMMTDRGKRKLKFVASQGYGTYKQVLEMCESRGGRLAVLTAIEIQNMKRTVGFDNGYIGLTDIRKEGKFVWINNRPISAPEGRTWSRGNPNNKRGHENCGTIVQGKQLNDDYCAKVNRGLCQVDRSLTHSVKNVTGVLINSTLVKGIVKVKFEKSSELMVDALLDVKDKSQGLTMILLKRNNASTQVCGPPLNMHLVYKTFEQVLFAEPTGSARNEQRFSLLKKFTVQPGAKLTDYVIVLQAPGNYEEFPCGEVAEYLELDWYRSISKMNSAVSMGKW